MQEASSIGHRNDIIDIYSNSWGLSDKGFVIDKPGTMMQMALHEGVTNVSEDQWLTLWAFQVHLQPAAIGMSVIMRSLGMKLV